MTYRELLKLYQDGTLDEEKRKKVEADIERQEAIGDYLYEKEEIPGRKGQHNPGNMTERKLGKTLKIGKNQTTERLCS